MNNLYQVASETKREVARCEQQLSDAKDNAFQDVKTALNKASKGDVLMLAAYGTCKLLGIPVPNIIPRVLRQIIESAED